MARQTIGEQELQPGSLGWGRGQEGRSLHPSTNDGSSVHDTNSQDEENVTRQNPVLGTLSGMKSMEPVTQMPMHTDTVIIKELKDLVGVRSSLFQKD
jgi:hypothetical protein